MSRARSVARLAPVPLALATVAGTAAAHEEYIVDGERGVVPVEFLAEAATDPAVIGPIAVAAVALLAVVVGYLRFRPVARDVAAFRETMADYEQFVPWLLRISFGIPLIGAGFGGYLISPDVALDLRIPQVALGFLLLFGLATRATALATLALYVVGALQFPDLLLQLEFVGGLAAIALLGSGRPSADHVLREVASAPGTVYGRIDPVHGVAERLDRAIEPYEPLVPTVARVGLGATFVYLGLSQKLLRPGIGLEVVAHYDLTAVVPVAPELWVLAAGLAEVGLGLALILGAFTRAGALVAIGLFALTLFALPDDPVLAHVSLFGLASALVVTGAGPYAVDGLLAPRETARAAPTPAD